MSEERPKNELGEVCDFCGKFISTTKEACYCSDCEVAPYCSTTCLEQDKSFHKKNENSCKKVTKEEISKIYQTFGLSGKNGDAIPTYGDESERYLTFAGPLTAKTELGERFSNAFRRDDPRAQEALKNYQNNEYVRGLYYYILRLRDAHRVFFGQLTQRQTKELGQVMQRAMNLLQYRFFSTSEKQKQERENNKNDNDEPPPLESGSIEKQ